MSLQAASDPRSDPGRLPPAGGNGVLPRGPQRSRWLDSECTDAGSTRLSALNASLMQDLLRFQRPQVPGAGLDLLEVLAASLRHTRALQLQLQLDHRTLALTVLPYQRQLRSPLSLAQLLALRLPALRVLEVEPADPAVDADAGWATAPLAPLLWELALRGGREALLPEIAGVAAYRVAPGADLHALDISGSLASAIDALRRQTTPLRQIAGWHGFDRERAMRLLNALYLQSALMVSRSHPAAIDGN